MSTREKIQRWQNDRTLAHVVPLAVFMLFLMPFMFFDGAKWFRWEHPSAPWWQQWPEQWLYPLQSFVGLALLIFFRKHYELKWSKSVWFGALMGAVGIGFWLLPTTLYDWLGIDGKPEGILKYLGVMPRTEGFDPGVFDSPAAYWASLILRFFRAVVIVSLVEEIFWRGFLMRFLLDRDGDYWKIPFGQPAWISYLVTTGAFMLAHAPVDYLGAFIYGSLTYFVAVRTKSLTACVVMHGVANLLMGCYALAYAKYGLW